MATLYVTAPEEGAADLAHSLVEQRVAACVNRVPCRSTYRWDGDVITEDETILLVKTTDEAAADAVERIAAAHPYDVPCIERFDEADALDAFADWVADSVAGD